MQTPSTTHKLPQNNKRLLFALNGMPSYGNHGGAQTCMAILEYFVEQKYDVTVLSLFDISKNNPYLAYKESNHNDLEQIGIDVKYIYYNHEELEHKRKSNQRNTLLSLIFPREQDYYYWSYLDRDFEYLMKDFKYDLVISYHFEPLSFFSKRLPCFHIAAIGDPTHTPIESQYDYYKKDLNLFSFKLFLQTIYAKMIYYPLMKSMMKRCDAQGAFAGHYADWLKNSLGFKNGKYFRTPVVDPLPKENGVEQIVQSREKLPNNKIKILLLGAITGTATRVGIEYFFGEVFPILKQSPEYEKLEFHLIGGGTIPSKVKDIVENEKCIIQRGRIEPVTDEILTSHIFLVPTPLDLGIRVRIITAMGHGVPIVAHISNKMGIPELEDGVNSLLSDSPAKMANDILFLISRENNLKFSKNSRNTYDNFFKVSIACKLIESVNKV